MKTIRDDVAAQALASMIFHRDMAAMMIRRASTCEPERERLHREHEIVNAAILKWDWPAPTAEVTA